LSFKGGFRGIQDENTLNLLITNSQSPFDSLPINRDRLFNIEVLFPIHDMQLKGDALRCCLSSNQLTSYVQDSSPFDFYCVMELNIAIQRGIQGDSERHSFMGIRNSEFL